MTFETDKSFTVLIRSGESSKRESQSDLAGKVNKERIFRTMCAYTNNISDARLNGVIAPGVDDSGFSTRLKIAVALESALLNIQGEEKIVFLPSLATNRSVLVGTDHIFEPLAAGVFFFPGLRNLGPTLATWRSGLQDRLRRIGNAVGELPAGRAEPVGHMALQHQERLLSQIGIYPLSKQATLA